ncbi:S41 family peptidase [Pedobacter sp. BAL39]|uniref:S41 family peptidase n=1 Tax=Pedobacter sp. BAL39 TaxID=391596 RepID=UPI0012FCBA98|nr:S41 family peptidase [Pedobacter sp. BAL39]
MLNAKQELYALTQYKLNPATGLPYEKTDLVGLSKYSYIENGSFSSGPVAALEGNGTAGIASEVSGKTGYLRIGEFANLSIQQVPLDNVFERFYVAGVTTLIVDLRDNRGGYIETAEYLANLIAGQELNGRKMYSEHFNTGMQAGKVRILENQRYYDAEHQPVVIDGRPATYADVDFSVAGNTFLFQKKGKLTTVKDVCFLVNGNTASASELLINVLRPYFPVKLLGSTTLGKPVGSFGIKIENYSLFMISFLIRNAKGSSDYFDGMQADILVENDGFGASAPAILNKVMTLIAQPDARGSLSRSAVADVTLKKQSQDSVYDVREPLMLENRLKLKL